jgi:hypothetical protein
VTFEEWLAVESPNIEKMQEFSKAPLPTTGAEISSALSLAFEYRQTAGELLAEINNYIIQARAKFTIEVKKKMPDFTAADRKVIVEDEIRFYLRAQNILEVTYSTLKEKCYALQRINQ